MPSFLQSTQFTDFYLLTWVLLHANLLLARGNGYLGMLYFLLILPVQAFSLTSSTGQDQVYYSMLIASTMFNIWLAQSLWKHLQADPWRGYRKLFQEIRKGRDDGEHPRGR